MYWQGGRFWVEAFKSTVVPAQYGAGEEVHLAGEMLTCAVGQAGLVALY